MRVLLAVSLLILIVLIPHDSFAAPRARACANFDRSRYMTAGNADDRTPEKIYNFTSMRTELLRSLETPNPNSCLLDFYNRSLQESASYWGAKLADEGCSVSPSGEISGDCPSASEARKSVRFLDSLDRELHTKVDQRLQQHEQAQNEAEGRAAQEREAALCAQRAREQAPLLAAQARTAACCGSPREQGGVVRASERGLSYQACIGKISPTNRRFLSGSGIGRCLVDAIKGAAQLMWNSLTSLLKLPGQLWAARSQIWALITKPEARQQFADKLMGAITGYFSNKVEAFKCYNSYEKQQFICRTGAQIIIMCAMPQTMGAFLGLAAKPAGLAARALGNIVSQAPGGARLVTGLNRGAQAGTAAGRRVIQARDAALASQGTVGTLARGTGRALSAANTTRRILGKPLAVPAQRLALAIQGSRPFRGLLVATYRLERRTRPSERSPSPSAPILPTTTIQPQDSPTVVTNQTGNAQPGLQTGAQSGAQTGAQTGVQSGAQSGAAPVVQSPVRPGASATAVTETRSPAERSRQITREISDSEIRTSRNPDEIRESLGRVREARARIEANLARAGNSREDIAELRLGLREARALETDLDRQATRVARDLERESRPRQGLISRVTGRQPPAPRVNPLPPRVELDDPMEFNLDAARRNFSSRYSQMGLRVDENNRLVSTTENRTAISNEIDELRRRTGVEVVPDYGSYAAVTKIRTGSQGQFRFALGRDFVEDPAKGLAELQKLNARARALDGLERSGVRIEDRGAYLMYEGEAVVTGSPTGNALSRLIYNINRPVEPRTAPDGTPLLGRNGKPVPVRQPISIRIDSGQGMRAGGELEARGLADSAGSYIKLDRDLVINDPELARAVLLHEVKHITTVRKGFSDRQIDFSSESKNLPVASYNDRFRADELEARLPQIASYRNSNVRSPGAISRDEIAGEVRQVRALADGQAEILRGVDSRALQAAQVEGRELVVRTNYRGQEVVVKFPVDSASRVTPVAQAEALISRRLEFLGNVNQQLQRNY